MRLIWKGSRIVTRVALFSPTLCDGYNVYFGQGLSPSVALALFPFYAYPAAFKVGAYFPPQSHAARRGIAGENLPPSLDRSLVSFDGTFHARMKIYAMIPARCRTEELSCLVDFRYKFFVDFLRSLLG